MQRTGNFAHAALLAFVLMVSAVPPAFADDCTDWGDCAMAPRNIDAATALAAAGPIVVLTWLYLNRRNDPDAVPVAPLAPTVIAANIDEIKKEFERLQEELRQSAVDELRRIDEFMANYDEKWRDGMFALEDYLQEYEHLLPGLERIWEQAGNRDDARRIAEALDEVIMITQLGVGLARGAASSAAREALQTARRAGTRAETETLRRAAREALGRDVQAAQRATAVERAAARRAAAEKAAMERAAAERAAIERARLAREAEEKALDEAMDRQIAELQRRRAAKEAEERALEEAMDRQVAEVTARRTKAETELVSEIQGLNPTNSCTNCAYTSEAVENTLAGTGRTPAPSSVLPMYNSYLETRFGGRFSVVGHGKQGKEAIEALLRQPNSRGIVRVDWTGEPVGHFFNGVNKNGFVLFPDGQTGGLMKDWDKVGEVMFLRTN